MSAGDVVRWAVLYKSWQGYDGRVPGFRQADQVFLARCGDGFDVPHFRHAGRRQLARSMGARYACLFYGHGQGDGLAGRGDVHAMHVDEIRVQMHAVARCFSRFGLEIRGNFTIPVL